MDTLPIRSHKALADSVLSTYNTHMMACMRLSEAFLAQPTSTAAALHMELHAKTDSQMRTHLHFHQSLTVTLIYAQKITIESTHFEANVRAVLRAEKHE